MADDTFEFRKHNLRRAAGNGGIPSGNVFSDSINEEGSSGESAEDSDVSEEEEVTQILPHDGDVSILDEETELADLNDGSFFADEEATPEAKLGVGKDWTEQLIQTISPVKRRIPTPYKAPPSAAKNILAGVGSLDFTESLFANKSRDFEV